MKWKKVAKKSGRYFVVPKYVGSVACESADPAYGSFNDTLLEQTEYSPPVKSQDDEKKPQEPDSP